MEHIIEEKLLPSLRDPNVLASQLKSDTNDLWNYKFLDKLVNVSLKEIYDRYESFEIDENKASTYLRTLKELLEEEIKELLEIMVELKRALVSESTEEQIDDVIKKAAKKIPAKPPERKREEFGILDMTKSNVKVKDAKKFVEMHKAGLIICAPEMVNNIYFIIRGLKVELLEYYYHNINKYVISFKWKTVR